jgi:menaquinone-9 beta-reductase
VNAEDQVVVIGGGVAGAAFAAALARAGRAVVVLERSLGPHDKVCGEFISGEAIRYLNDLGIDPTALGAVAIDAVRVCAGDRVTTARLPFAALSLSRRALDQAILRVAASFGADIRRGARVRGLQRIDGSWLAECEGGEVYPANTPVVATGKHDLRGFKRPQGIQSDLVAFKLHVRLAAREAAALAGHVELTLFAGGYAGLEPVERGAANLCLVVRRAAFAALDRRWETLLLTLRACCPHLDRRLAGAVALFERPLAITAIPYGYVRGARTLDSDGPWYLGDQAAVIPSFCGDGMAIALHSARLAACHYLAGRTAKQYQAQLARDVGRQVRGATLLSQIAVAPLGQALTATAMRVPGIMRAIAGATRVAEHPQRRLG